MQTTAKIREQLLDWPTYDENGINTEKQINEGGKMIRNKPKEHCYETSRLPPIID